MADQVLLDNERFFGGVLHENRDTMLVYGLPKGTSPRKRSLKPVKNAKDGETDWEIPKSDTFAYAVHNLVDGSRVQITRFKPIPFADRKAMFDKIHAEQPKLRLIAPSEKKSTKRDDPSNPRNFSLDLGGLGLK